MAATGASRVGGGGVPLGRLLVLIAVAGVGAIGGWFGFRTAFGQGAKTTTPLQSVTVQARTVQQTALTSGTITTPYSSKLTFQQAGRLALLNIRQGQNVAQGDIIGTLDTTQLQIALDQARSTQNTNQAKLDALLAGQTPDVVEAARSGLAQAIAAEQTAEGQVGTAQTGKITAANAVNTARNQVTTAQTTANGAQDSVANAQNGVGTAQNNVTTAQSGLTNAMNGVTTAQNAYQTAQNSVTTAQFAVTTAQNNLLTAQNTVITDENNLQTAQNNYQALLNGPQAEDVGVSQSAVDNARASLQAAQFAYDRLVNHTDLATRAETTALVQAEAAYQTALAALANAEPQPPNPYDLIAAQQAVQAAGAQVGAATATANLAEQNYIAAQVTAACSTPPVVNLSYCPADTSTNPTTAATNQASAGAVSAQTAAISAANSVTTAQSNYQTALNNLNKLLNPISTTNLSGLQGQVDSTRQLLETARRNYDNLITLADLPTRPEATALQTAQSAYNTALAQYNLKVAPAKQTDLANAQNSIAVAQAALDSARTAVDNARVAIDTAQKNADNAVIAANTAKVAVDTANSTVASDQAALSNAQLAVSTAQIGVDSAQQAADNAITAISTAQIAVTSAQATANNSDATITTAQSGVDAANANIAAMQKKLDQLIGGPLATDVTQAVEAVRTASLAVSLAQTNIDNATLRAPFSGTVLGITANVGDQITAATAIAQLVDTSRTELDAQVDETTLGQIKLGMAVTFTLDSVPNQQLAGFITTIIPNGTTVQGVVLFPVVITVTTPGVVLPVQASASQIRVITASRANVPAIDPRYIYRDANSNQVVDRVVDGKRMQTKITTGLVQTAPALTEVTSGLQPGDQVAMPVKNKAGATTTFGQGGLPGAGGGGGGGAGGAP